MSALRTMGVAGAARALEALGQSLGAGHALAQPVEADHDGAPTERDEADPPRLTGTPALGIAGRHIEVHAPGPGAIEGQPSVHLEERKVRADEDRVVRRVQHVDLGRAPPGVERDRPRPEQNLAGLHRAPPGAGAARPGRMGASTWSTRIPSPNRHSILTVPISSATPSITSSALTALWPALITSS